MDFREFGKAIASLRKIQKVSQNRLCEDLSISRATLSSFENGRGVDIGFRKVLQIVDYLGYKFDLNEKSMFPSFEELRDAR